MRLVRDLLFDAMEAEGIPFLFGNPGTTELPIIQGCAERGLRYVMALHEDVAVGMAMGYAHATGKPGVVNLHVAPGLAHGLGNLYNAFKAGLPLVVTAGQQHTELLIQEPILAGDLVGMARPMCKWAYQVNRPEEMALALHRAFKVAQTAPQGPVFLALPPDVMLAPTDVQLPPPSRVDMCGTPAPGSVARAADLLLSARNPLLLVGDGVGRADAGAPVAALAELLGLPVMAEPLSVWLNFPTDHPLYVGHMPGGNMKAARSSLAGYDLLLLVGFSSQAAVAVHDGNGPLLPQSIPTIYINTDPWEVGKNGPAAVGMAGDVALVVSALGDEVRRRALPHDSIKERRDRTVARAEARRKLVAERAAANHESRPMHVSRLIRELGDRLRDPYTIIAEAISNTSVLLDCLPLARAVHWVGVKGGGLGHSMPAALGVQLARPGCRVVCVVGDGTALYYPQALWTAAHERLPITFLVLNNSTYRVLKQGLAGMGGPWGAEKRETPGLDIIDPLVDWVALARGFGVPARRVEDPADLGFALDWALSSDGPVLLDAAIDGNP